MTSITINGRQIGSGHPVYIIAEMSANHGQDFARAERIIHAMKDAGADAVKIQTYTPNTMTIDAKQEHFQIGKGTIWEGKSLYELYGEAFTPWEWQPKLQKIAQSLGLDFFSTPYDETSVEFLESMNVPAYKVASFELIDLPLIRRIAKTGKPMIISTGMAVLQEIEEAVAAAEGSPLALLQCTSAYPSPPEEMNLRTIPDLAKRFNVPVGLSDHSLEIAVPIAAVTLGARIVEKHFTLDRSEPGPDSAFSLEPHEFRLMVDEIRIAEKALGEAVYRVTPREEATKMFRRSIFVVEDIKKGEKLTRENVRCIRPGHGLSPKHYDEVLGRTAKQNIERGTPLAWELIA